MRNKRIKISIAFTAIFLAIGLFIFGISQLVSVEATTIRAQATTTNARSSGGGTLASGEKNPNSYSYNISMPGEWEAITGVGTDYQIPSYSGKEIYCITPGNGVKYWQYGIRLDKAREVTSKKYYSSCGCAATPFEGALTPPIYYPAGGGTLSPAAAYIISDEPIGVWTREKQRALWHLNQSGIDGGLIHGSDPFNQASDPLDQEAIDYADYDDAVRGQGLNPTDRTDLNDVYAKINQASKEYTVGPFNISYTNGIYGNIAFSGISNIQVVGYNSKKQQVRSNIRVKEIILGNKTTGYGSGRRPQYFTPSSDLKVDETAQVYPKSRQDFQVVFDDPNQGLAANDPNRVAYISLKIHFKYMLANGKYTKLNGLRYEVTYSHNHSYNNPHWDCTGSCHEVTEYDDKGNPDGSYTCHHDVKHNGCITTGSLPVATYEQDLIAADAIRSIYEEELEVCAGALISTSMDLGGHVWEDGVATKEGKADGVSNTTGNAVDKPIRNVKVTLYTSDGKVATLLSNPNESGITAEKVMHRVNPTYTDSEGNYLFEGLDPMKKYYVRFEYNGQVYLPTEYLNTATKQYASVADLLKEQVYDANLKQTVNARLYFKDEWKVSSKGTESAAERDAYDKKFAEIGSYPQNYKTSNSLNQVGQYNATFTAKDLMGYTLDRNGKYKQTGTQLIDGYLYDENGLETTTYSEGVISQRVRQYIEANRKYPDTNAMLAIYTAIANGNKETWQKLQFIEDCKIESYTQGQGKDTQKDLYPVFNAFKINHEVNNKKAVKAGDAQTARYDMTVEVLDGVRYEPIYAGQFFVNQGLWRRQEYDTSMRKDVYRAIMKINNKTVMYKYDKRTDDEAYWDIHVRMSDYNGYYNTGYNREVYVTDYNYSSQALNHPGADLEIYVTYKLTIRNQSQSIMSQIREVVDYYDKEYTYRDDLSWVTYMDGSKNNDVSDQEYYDAMVAEDVSKIASSRPTKSATSSRYGSATHSNVANTYQAVYIRGLEDKKLATGESAYIYLTFQVKKQNDKVILDSESNPKMNLAEINGYTTFYRNNTILPNGIKKSSNDVAGLIDRDSNPGNLVAADINDRDRYEKNFEDDTDRAKGLRILIDNTAIRKASGTVWEDQRTVKAGNAMVGNGIRENNEKKIAGVTVQLVEKTVDGKEYIWQETTTDANGAYSFESYIPADYVIRFYYGHNASTVKVKGNNDYTAGGLHDVSYNGQDFKSTTYQAGITQSRYTDEANRYTGYTNTNTQNETGTYGYDIYASDRYNQNVSDAKDLWSVSNIPSITYRPNTQINEKRVIQGRQTVINYSSKNVTNHKAEVLASPYETPSYNGIKYTTAEMNSLINELIQNTYMTAETGVIAVEFEYDRQQSEGIKTTENNKGNSSNDYVTQSNRYNGGYDLKNIDFGIVERPKAQLELDKSITNVKVTLANGSTLFDARQAGDNVIWKDHAEYGLGNRKNGQGKYEEYYSNNGKNRYSYSTEVDKLVNRTDKGLIQLTIDEELMHGATIELTYKLKVTNIGEVDYEGQRFYYLADAAGAQEVTTVTEQVIDYVANNLQFNGSNTSNNKWTVIQTANLIPSKDRDEDANLVNRRLGDKVAKHNSIIQTDGFNKALKVGESVEKTLILTQLISTENTSDDLTYKNMAEIAKTSNTVGRRMSYTVVGNQDPTAAQGNEVDASVAERVVILPPFGNAHIYYILGAVIAIILTFGITVIIKKVLRK